MVNNKQLTKWLLGHSATLSLKATYCDWVKTWLPGYHDFGVTIKIGGKVFNGRGIDVIEEVAFIKASVESIERAFIYSCGLESSNGVAGHVEKESAIINAKLELIERDIFLCHYFTRYPFQIINSQTIHSLSLDINGIKKRLQKKGVELVIAKMKSVQNIYNIICATFGSGCNTPFGVIIGLGSAHCQEDAINKAIIECLRNCVSQIDNPVSATSLDEFRQKTICGFEDHYRLGLHPSSENLIKDL